MKKHELIKHAYNNYPKGIHAQCLLTGNVKVADGPKMIDINGNIWDSDSASKDVTTGDIMVYDGTTQEWATIVEAQPEIELINPSYSPESDLLDGKVAIRVNNELEFRALMMHYEEKRWETFTNLKPSVVLKTWNIRFPYHVTYCDNFEGYRDPMGFGGLKIIEFPDFAAQTGIRMPLLKSEDEVDLFKGDDYWQVCLALNEGWIVRQATISGSNSRCITHPDHHKAFSTREAAEAWVAEKNRPKEIKLHSDTPVPCTVYQVGVKFHVSNFNTETDDGIELTGSELEEIYAAYQQVKGGQHGA